MKWLFRHWVTTGTLLVFIAMFFISNDGAIAFFTAIFAWVTLLFIHTINEIDKQIEANKREKKKRAEEARQRAAAEERRRADARRSVMERDGVEIVRAGTFGPLAVSHAQVKLRNRNSYDVDVRIQLYQNGQWRDASISYSEQGTDRIDGVSDDNSEAIRVKANSMRSVNLTGKFGGGRPDAFRIVDVD